ncbi:DUF4450 domain-containing protein [Chitinophaga horti]|uniref:DUF4450 domain-containing protein n=1 Tax=Chitinophaga horti TaxID=2920382 RepID=A0ABY6J6Z9_9BACT|nr:DUF4450 domain-containing protein [Chitinophaga horti]UYQ94037.1 DUF4450 domain-containing protein [Chitinophaga horti]
MRGSKRYLVTLLVSCACGTLQAQEPALWHNKPRSVHYLPEGSDFVCTNGKLRFNRALYGTNTGFRAEAGDLPEFALYLPGMGGNLRLGLMGKAGTKWLTEAQHIKATYRPGAMLYEITDPMLGNGSVQLQVLALADAEGLIIRTNFKNVTNGVEIVWAYGGATGKKFSRDGDIGADPESVFYLHAANCKDNQYTLNGNRFTLTIPNGKRINGQMPGPVRTSDASFTTPDAIYTNNAAAAPIVTGKFAASTNDQYLLLTTGEISQPLPTLFKAAEAARQKLVARVKLQTPDKYLNTLGGALSVAGDAIWEAPTYLHGAVAWRMRLNAWRGAYVADPLGWHDRARQHFSSYALSQITTPPVTGVVADTALNLARQQEKVGNALFSDGYICRNPNGDIRAHHYDMNLVFVDQLLNHFNWTGDTAYLRQQWPLLKRHLAWEKRNFDADNDGLYDAYAAIWASDALQYSGGGVTHTSAYNYRANKTVAQLAKLIGEDATPYEKEATHIAAAVSKQLWLSDKGWYAEYKDLLGNQLVHTTPGIWTIYHALDAQLPDAFQSWQSLQYIRSQLPHIPVKATGWNENNLQLVSTTNWQPYTWSINNVALAENLHAALAYWQGNRAEDAFSLFRSSLLESMYLGASPGNFQQLSFYDAVRGELYRDFADPVGMAARALVEGLFGIQPDLLNNRLRVQPGLPAEWNDASLQVPDVSFSFKRNNNTETYTITPTFGRSLELELVVPAFKDDWESIIVNGKPAKATIHTTTVGRPLLVINAAPAKVYSVVVQWKGQQPEVPVFNQSALNTRTADILKVYDPQSCLEAPQQQARKFTAQTKGTGNKTFFIQLKQGRFTWWQPVNFDVAAVSKPLIATNINERSVFESVSIPFNDKVGNIFKQRYLSPRPAVPTLQLPTQGIGNWCYPNATANIDDSGLRKAAGSNNQVKTTKGIPFQTPSDTLKSNVLFTSMWDNYPDQATVPLTGKASHVWLLMAGSTNPMQSRMCNGVVEVNYTDGSKDTLELRNPENWWPIEQNYLTDGYAFTTGAPAPERLYLKEGVFATNPPKYDAIKGFSTRAVQGGAATVLDMPLQADKTLQSVTLRAITNDVVIGLMAATLLRN